MSFSAFTGFGFLEFSSRKPPGQTIYENLRRGLGGDDMLGEDTFTGPLAGKLYATAMEIACVQAAIDHVYNEARPGKTREHLKTHERDFRVVVPAKATEDERRQVLAIKERVAEGNAGSRVYDVLSELLGSHLVAIRKFNENDYTAYPSNWETAGNWRKASTVGGEHALSSRVWPGYQTFTLVEQHGPLPENGDIAMVDPGKLGIEEVVSVSVDGSGTMAATFARAHESGAIMSTNSRPRAASTARHLLIVTDATVARSPAWRKKIHATLHGMMCAIDNWSVVEEYTTGQLGPFYPNEGLPNITPIVQTTTAEAT